MKVKNRCDSRGQRAVSPHAKQWSQNPSAMKYSNRDRKVNRDVQHQSADNNSHCHD